MTKKSVVVQSAPRKPYHPSPVQDSKRCGFGGLLSRAAVHAANRDGENHSSSAVLRNRWREEGEVLVRLAERSDLTFIGAREGGERAAPGAEGNKGEETNRQQPKGAAFAFNLLYSNNSFHLPSDLSYTRSA